MRILCACEETQAVTIELRALGFEAYSCDIEPCSGGHPEWHIQQDVLPLLNGHCSFVTMDGGGTRDNRLLGYDHRIPALYSFSSQRRKTF